MVTIVPSVTMTSRSCTGGGIGALPARVLRLAETVGTYLRKQVLSRQLAFGCEKVDVHFLAPKYDLIMINVISRAFHCI